MFRFLQFAPRRISDAGKTKDRVFGKWKYYIPKSTQMLSQGSQWFGIGYKQRYKHKK